MAAKEVQSEKPVCTHEPRFGGVPSAVNGCVACELQYRIAINSGLAIDSAKIVLDNMAKIEQQYRDTTKQHTDPAIRKSGEISCYTLHVTRGLLGLGLNDVMNSQVSGTRHASPRVTDFPFDADTLKIRMAAYLEVVQLIDGVVDTVEDTEQTDQVTRQFNCAGRSLLYALKRSVVKDITAMRQVLQPDFPQEDSQCQPPSSSLQESPTSNTAKPQSSPDQPS